MLNDRTCWELNMLWSEKIQFVKEIFEKKYFDTEFYGWCDIGYFRNRPNNIHTSLLTNWGDNTILLNTNKNKICYACVQNDDNYISFLHNIINNRNDIGLPITPIPVNQISISGGFLFYIKTILNGGLKHMITD